MWSAVVVLIQSFIILYFAPIDDNNDKDHQEIIAMKDFEYQQDKLSMRGSFDTDGGGSKITGRGVSLDQNIPSGRTISSTNNEEKNAADIENQGFEASITDSVPVPSSSADDLPLIKPTKSPKSPSKSPSSKKDKVKRPSGASKNGGSGLSGLSRYESDDESPAGTSIP